MAFRFLLRNSLKLVATGGAVYITINQGIWGNGEESEEACQRLLNLMPGTQEYLTKIKGEIKKPIEEYAPKDLSHYWNTGVIYFFAGLTKLPCTIGKYSHIAVDKITQTIQETTK